MKKDFRPQWGIGGSMLSKLRTPALQSFRPRVGMGWFFKIKELKTNEKVFVPEWGWVGSAIIIISCNVVSDFRPRLGIGWFYGITDAYTKGEVFSSPLGDGLVLFCGVLFFSFFRRFSSPLGDGLVRKTRTHSALMHIYFRPRVGMGWFRGQTYIRCPHHEFFVPEWGWVGSPQFCRN